MTGLFALLYIGLHFLDYLALDQGFAWPFIIEDILERPFITLGALALLGLIPLGISSTAGWRRLLTKVLQPGRAAHDSSRNSWNEGYSGRLIPASWK